MKITDIKVFTVNPGVGKNLMFVKMETDAAITGWGEAYTQSDRTAPEGVGPTSGSASLRPLGRMEA